MRPSARIAALIELIDEVEEGITNGGAPADVTLSNFFRARRYAGSKDRRFISTLFYKILRQRALLHWVSQQAEATRSGRFFTLSYCLLFEPDLLEAFSEAEGQYGPEPLSAAEEALAKQVRDLDLDQAPLEARENVPDWAVSGFEDRYDDSWRQAARALNTQAPVDLRLNLHKTKGKPRSSFQDEGGQLSPTSMSPIGLRSEKNIALGSQTAYKRGFLEVQDEAAQIASLLVDAKPGMQVADLCAGAGGKSLTISAQMKNKGQIHALDVSNKRLRECKKRAQRTGCRNIQVRPLTIDGSDRAAELAKLKGACDRVLVDVPCSGSGTWRRSPDQRWRMDSNELSALNEVQFQLLCEGANLTKENGRLLYMTCSVLPQENEAVVSKFLAKNSNWQLLPYTEIWPHVLDCDAPRSLAIMDGALQLSPETHNTDGFFVSILVRSQ